jgi:hypothetical protein
MQIKGVVQAQLPAFKPTFVDDRAGRGEEEGEVRRERGGGGGKENNNNRVPTKDSNNYPQFNTKYNPPRHQLNPSHSLRFSSPPHQEVTYVINCCPWVTAAASDLAEEIVRRENSSRICIGSIPGSWSSPRALPPPKFLPSSSRSSTSSEANGKGPWDWEDDGTATGFSSHAVEVMMGLIRSASDSALNKFDRSCGMPPFILDSSVRYVALGMIEAAKVAGDWVERNEMVEVEGRKETVGEIERSSHAKANEIIHLNGTAEGAGQRERAMRVHQLSQALCYKRIERGGREGRIR